MLAALVAFFLLIIFGYGIAPFWRTANRRTRIALGLFCATPLVGYGFIGQLGLPDAPLAARLNQAPNALPFQGNVARLHMYVQANPQDAQAWAMLARARFAFGQHARSEQAWRRALAIAPTDDARAQAHSGIAENLVQQADGLVSDAAAAHFTAAHAADTSLLAPLYFLGLHAAQQTRFAQAQKFWQQLGAQAPDDSPYHRLVQQQSQKHNLP